MTMETPKNSSSELFEDSAGSLKDKASNNKVTISFTFYIAINSEKLATLRGFKTTEPEDVKKIVEKPNSTAKNSDKGLKSLKSVTPGTVPSMFCANFEYSMQPLCKNPIIIDIAADEKMAKVCVAGKESKIVSTWNKEPLIWIVWTNNHVVTPREDDVQKIANQMVDVTLSMDPKKLSNKVKQEKIKFNKISDDEEGGTIRKQVEGLLSLLETINGQCSASDLEEKNQLRKMVASSVEKKYEERELMNKVMNDSMSEFHETKDGKSPKRNIKQKEKEKMISDRGKKTEKSKETAEQNVNAEPRYESYVARICLAKFVLASKDRILLREFLPQNLVSSPFIERAYVLVEMSGINLMSETQLNYLNPCLISITSAYNLPSHPADFYQMQTTCEPSYVSHCFLNDERFKHRSHGIPQYKNVTWDDHFVIFLGTIDSHILKEYFYGPGLVIEVHDRDLKCIEKASLFGSEEDDFNYSNTYYVPYKRALHKTLTGGDKTAYHGRSILNLHEILLGEVSLKYVLNVTNSSIPLAQRKSTNLLGNYITSGSVLNVAVFLHHSFVPRYLLMNKMRFCESEKSPFVRLIVKFSHDNNDFLKLLLNMITKVNICALDKEHLNYLDQQIILNTHKMTSEQIYSSSFDAITGFHVCDQSMHVILLEGIQNGLLLNSVYNLLQSPNCHKNGAGNLGPSVVNTLVDCLEVHDSNNCSDDEKENKVKVMYHSNITFQSRLYSGFNLNFQTIQLQDKIDAILSHPLIHVRDVVTNSCYTGLIKMYQIHQANTIADVVANDGFPFFDELAALTKEFSSGTCLNHLELFAKGASAPSKMREMPI